MITLIEYLHLFPDHDGPPFHLLDHDNILVAINKHDDDGRDDDVLHVNVKSLDFELEGAELDQEITQGQFWMYYYIKRSNLLAALGANTMIGIHLNFEINNEHKNAVKRESERLLAEFGEKYDGLIDHLTTQCYDTHQGVPFHLLRYDNQPMVTTTLLFTGTEGGLDGKYQIVNVVHTNDVWKDRITSEQLQDIAYAILPAITTM